MNEQPHQQDRFDLPPPVTDVPQPVQDAGQPLPTQQSSPVNTATPVAQDTDTIEAEWVHNVERLIRDNINDPKVLSAQFSSLKEQYISSRYGKTLKSSQGQNKQQ